MLYCILVLVPGEPTGTYIYFVCALRETALCIVISSYLLVVSGTVAFSLVTSPAIWWRSVEFHRESVTFAAYGLTLLKYSVRLVCWCTATRAG
jgi:hypothetical protein